MLNVPHHQIDLVGLNGDQIPEGVVDSWLTQIGGIVNAVALIHRFHMDEWTDAFIANAQQELVDMVKDWPYDYGAEERALIHSVGNERRDSRCLCRPPARSDGPS